MSAEENKQYPDPTSHLILSLVKSSFRIGGFALLPFNLGGAAGMLIMAEVLGIAEELV
jgi:hypothetical protein